MFRLTVPACNRPSYQARPLAIHTVYNVGAYLTFSSLWVPEGMLPVLKIARDRRADVAAEQGCLPSIVCGDIRHLSCDATVFFAKRTHSAIVTGAGRHVACPERRLALRRQIQSTIRKVAILVAKSKSLYKHHCEALFFRLKRRFRVALCSELRIEQTARQDYNEDRQNYCSPGAKSANIDK